MPTSGYGSAPTMSPLYGVPPIPPQRQHTYQQPPYAQTPVSPNILPYDQRPVSPVPSPYGQLRVSPAPPVQYTAQNQYPTLASNPTLSYPPAANSFSTLASNSTMKSQDGSYSLAPLASANAPPSPQPQPQQPQQQPPLPQPLLPPLKQFPSSVEPPLPPLSDSEIDSICMRLSVSTRGVLTDSSIITMTQICASYTPTQMAQIGAAYKRQFAANLADVISTSETSLIITACTMAAGSVAEADAIGILESLKGLAVDYDALYEVLLGRTNDELAAIRKSYQTFFDKDLDKALSEKLKSSVWKVFAPLIQGKRAEGGGEDGVKMAETLKGLCKSSSGEAFAHVLGCQSVENLRRGFEKFTEKYGVTLEKTIIKEFSSDVEKPLLAIVSSP
ncbi:hypothetical protein BC829DRAFT_9799 [Chytridium lagenaria]|nr:hypothetical protein BC829DRAFT_9799 [Chytridium lagenaria]